MRAAATTKKPAGAKQGLVRGFYVALVMVIVQWVIAGVFYRQLPPEVPLFYSLPLGTNQLADKFWFFVLPAISSGFILINILGAKAGLKIDLIIGQLIWWTTVLMMGLVLIAQIYMLVLVL